MSMSLFKLIPQEIPDNNPKISVGVIIRKITVYLNDELLRVIKELAPMNNIENKKNTLQILVRELHNAVKKLHKFVKNVKKFGKISHIDKLSMILYEFNTRVTESINQLFYTNEMCKFYRSPTFNLDQISDVVNNYSHQDLKKKMSSIVNNVVAQEKKEKVFYFLERFFYGENINEKDIPRSIEKIKLESLFELNLASKLLKLQNLERKESVGFKNEQFFLKFGEVTFNVVIFSFQTPDNNYSLSYYCNEILLSQNQKFFIKTTESVQKYISYLNNNLIFPSIQISIPSDIKDYSLLNLKLFELQTILRQFTSKYIHSNVFKQIKIYLKEYINKKLKVPFTLKSPNINEMNLTVNYATKSITQPTAQAQDFYINLKIDSSADVIDNFTLSSSHLIVNESPLVFTKNHSEKIYFCNLGKLNIEKIICSKIDEFKKIQIYLIYEKLRKIKSIFIPFNVKLNEDNSKISFYFSETLAEEKSNFLLFSVINNLKGEIQIIDDLFVFKSNSNKENNILLKDFIVYHINNNINLDQGVLLQFNEFVFSNFLFTYFNMFHQFFSYEKFNHDRIGLKFLIMDNKSTNRRMLINIPIAIHKGNKINFNSLNEFYFEVFDTIKSESIFKLPLREVINQDKASDRNKIFSAKCSPLNSDSMQKFQISTLKNIYHFINHIQHSYDDLFRNIIDCMTYITNPIISPGNLILTISTKEILSSDSIKSFLDKDNLEAIEFYIKEVQIHRKNLIFKIVLKEENLKSKFANREMSNYSIMDNDSIILFNCSDLSINIYFLTKMNIKTINEYSHYKRFFSRILNKLLNFIKKASGIVNTKEINSILSDPQTENILISPIGIQFKHKFFNLISKTIIVQFVNVMSSEKKNMRCNVLPLEYQMQTTYSLDMFFKLLQDCDECTLMVNLLHFLFFFCVFDKLAKKFSTFVFPVGKNTYDLMTSQNKIFIFFKDHKTFHIIKQNRLSIFIEVVSPHVVNIFSSYLWNSENCFKFMDSIICNNEISSKTSQSAINCSNQKKMIVLSNDPISLLRDISTILDYIERF